MTSINDLFDLILEEIFLRLPFKTRLICKEVCYRWYELLMTRTIFREDRHIYLTNCLLEPYRPPMSILMKAKFPYERLTFHNKNPGLPLCADVKETRKLWKHLRIQEFNYRRQRYESEFKEVVFEIMPQIQVVSFENDLVRYVEGLSKISNFFKGQRTIKVKWHIGLKLLTQIANNVKNSRVIVENFFFNQENDCIEDLLTLPNNVTINVFHMKCQPGENNILSKISFMETTQFNGMKLDFERHEPPFDLMKSVFDKHLNIRRVEIQSKFVVFPFSFEQLTTLKIPSRGDYEPDVDTFKHLENLPNLETLELHFIINHFHMVPLLPKLRTFSSTYPSIRCHECVETLTDAFPNLIYLETCFDLNDNRFLLLIFEKLKYLQTCRILGTRYFEPFKESIESLSKPHLHLRTLHIELFGNHTKDCLLNLSKVFPNLNTLRIEMNEDTKLIDIVMGILPGFKHLTSLSISRFCRNLDKGNLKAVIQHLKKHGKSLRILNVTDLEKELPKLAKELFKHLDQLCVVNNYRRDERL